MPSFPHFCCAAAHALPYLGIVQAILYTNHIKLRELSGPS